MVETSCDGEYGEDGCPGWFLPVPAPNQQRIPRGTGQGAGAPGKGDPRAVATATDPSQTQQPVLPLTEPSWNRAGAALALPLPLGQLETTVAEGRSCFSVPQRKH